MSAQRSDAPPDRSPSTPETDVPEWLRVDENNPWQLAMEGSGAGIWDWDLATGLQVHSRRWEEMLGYSGSEVAGGYDAFAAMVHPDDLERVRTAVNAYLEGSAPRYAVDMRMRCKDGSW